MFFFLTRIDGIKLFLDVELASKYTDPKLWKKQEDAIGVNERAVETLEQFGIAVEKELEIARQALDEKKKRLTSAIDLTKNEERPPSSSVLLLSPSKSNEFKRPQDVISTPAPNKTSEVNLKPAQTNPNHIWCFFLTKKEEDFCSRSLKNRKNNNKKN